MEKIEKKFRKVVFNKYQKEEIDQYIKKFNKANVSQIYEALNKLLEQMKKIGKTTKDVGELDVLSRKSFLIILKLNSKINSNADNSYFLSEGRRWIKTKKQIGFSAEELHQFIEILAQENDPETIDFMHYLLIHFFENYKEEVYKGTKHEKLKILQIISRFFISVYKYSLMFIGDSEISEKISKWESPINKIFNVHVLAEELFPVEGQYTLDEFEDVRVYYRACTLHNFFWEKNKNKKIEIIKQELKKEIIQLEEWKKSFGIKLIPVSIYPKNNLEITSLGNNKYADKYSYLIKSFKYFREIINGDNFKLMSSIELENLLIAVVALAEKTFFTFVKIITEEDESINDKIISPISDRFWSKLKPVLNQKSNFSLLENLITSFQIHTFYIWSDNDLGQKYKKKSSGLRNMIVHRNPLYYETYTIDSLQKETKKTFELVAKYLGILAGICIIFPYKNEEIMKDNFVLHGLKIKKEKQKMKIPK